MAKKRGRKRRTDFYFGPAEEEAVVKFLASTDDLERNRIYNEFLRKPLDKMIESIIRRYKLYRKNYSFEDLHADTLSFLITKAHKFDTESGTKAYSYYGTICKNYLLALIIKDDKTIRQNVSFEDAFESIEEREDLVYNLEDTNDGLSDFIQVLSNEIRVELNADSDESKKKLTDNERKVGIALVDIFENWETIFENVEGSSKYNKNTVLATIREYTNLSTKDIRTSMRRYKSIYDLMVSDMIDEGTI